MRRVSLSGDVSGDDGGGLVAMVVCARCFVLCVGWSAQTMVPAANIAQRMRGEMELLK